MANDREPDEYEDNIHFQAFRFCLNARLNGWTREEVLSALTGQWQATEPVAARKVDADAAPSERPVSAG